MTEDMFPKATADLAKRRKSLAPEVASTFHDFSKAVFREGALSRKHKQLIAVAVAHVIQCPSVLGRVNVVLALALVAAGFMLVRGTPW
ncbi:MAG: carboxymuconolactone decarboxylase family protein [Deltaproteobacteria bacterium]|nr:carboxymuconolactone decarboxylase family protein [Deltaproteobacteria bacterium]